MQFEKVKVKDYNYMIVGNHSRQLPFVPEKEIDTPYFSITKEGLATIKHGYMIDGCSGIAIDGKINLIPCAWHDLNFQLTREGYLSFSLFDKINLLFYHDLLKAGFNKVRAWYYWKAVSIFGKKYAKPKK